MKILPEGCTCNPIDWVTEIPSICNCYNPEEGGSCADCGHEMECHKEMKPFGTGQIMLPSGYTLYWKPNGAGGRTYYSDEVCCGTTVWDTCLSDKDMILAAIAMEEKLGPIIKEVVDENPPF